MTNTEKVNILVVDDLEEKLLVYETILEGLGQNLVMARSGREALRHLLEDEFAVILLDVHMPDMDGLETAAMIRNRRQTAHTPIIFVTAFSDEMHTVRGYSLGAVDYILTPVVPEILRTKVGVFVDLYEKTRQVERQAEERVALARAQAERAAAEEATRRLSFLAEASTVLVRTLDYDAIPRGLARQAVPFLGDLCAITLMAEDAPDGWNSELAWIAPPGASGEGMPIQTASVVGNRELGVLSSLIQSVMEKEQGEVFLDLSLPESIGSTGGCATPESSGSGISPLSRGSGNDHELRSALVVPLYARGRTLGTIALALGGDRRRYGPEELSLATDLAGRAAIAIDNARLYRDVQANDRRKNEFLAMLAHELRNPLAPIRNAVEILRMLDIPEPNLQWANDVISRQVEQMVRLVDDLLDISRITGGKIQLRMAPVDAALAVSRGRDQPAVDRRPAARADREPPCGAGARPGRPRPAGTGAGQPPQ